MIIDFTLSSLLQNSHLGLLLDLKLSNALALIFVRGPSEACKKAV